MATDKPIKQPLQRVGWRIDPWKGELRPLPKGGASAASQMYPHLRSKFDPAPTQREPTPLKGKR
jgi:hypothetical protein